MYTIQGSDHKEYGPVDAATVMQWLQSGRANAQTMIKKDAGAWAPLAHYPEFAAVLSPAASAANSPATGAGSGGAVPQTKAPKVFGILNIVFGSLCCLCNGAAIPLSIIGFEALEQQYGVDFGWTAPVSLLMMGVAVLLCIVLSVAGIGLLKSRMWGRNISVVYSVAGILLQIISLIINLVFMPEIMANVPASEIGGSNNPVVVVGGSCIALIYPVVLLIFMNKQSVKQALH